MSNTYIKVWKAVSAVLVGVVVLLAILLVGVRLVGLQVYTVLSPSMEPNYHTGSLIYVREVDAASLQTRDVITFTIGNGMTATHRIIELVPDDQNPTYYRFRTQGDANDTPDGALVEPSQVIGTPVFTIPYLGYLASYIQQPPGSYVAIAVGLGMILLVAVTDILTGGKKGKAASADSAADASSDGMA